jgi:quercetin dioxygenase-like cupin family protein
MTPAPSTHGPDQADLLALYVLEALPPSEAAALEEHIAGCGECQRELDSLRPVIDTFVAWPTDVLRPSPSLAARLAQRIAADTGREPAEFLDSGRREMDWEEVAPGISCKLLATDPEGHRVSMLVHLEPGAAYPPHTHAGVEELHLLEGELMIDEKKLYPGDYNIAEPGTSDRHVWSETGCTCVLITSTRDQLR